jgi:hypothetical protein
VHAPGVDCQCSHKVLVQRQVRRKVRAARRVRCRSVAAHGERQGTARRCLRACGLWWLCACCQGRHARAGIVLLRCMRVRALLGWAPLAARARTHSEARTASPLRFHG